jgi:tripartite motif-containing protein 71
MLSRTPLIASVTMLLTFTSIADAADLLYVTMNDYTIVTYNTSNKFGSTVESTRATLVDAGRGYKPWGLAIDSNGNLFATNGANGTISKFNSSGKYISSITSNLNSVSGLAFDSKGNLYATNNGYYINKYNSSGEYISSISSNLNGVTGLAFDTSDNLYAANNYDDTISKFNSSGLFLSTIGSGKLSYPQGLAFDSSGNLYAANNFSNFISKFNSSGDYISSISPGGGLLVNSPIGLTFDSSGNLYVANFGNSSISKFDPSGNFLYKWSTGSSLPISLAFKPNTVPEPSTYILAAIATCAMVYVVRKRHLKPLV